MTAATTTRAGAGAPEVVQAGEHRLARVESLRAVAALGVAAGHAWGTAHGFQPAATKATFLERVIFGGGFGVYLFFALSGYLLFWPFARRYWGGGAAIDLRRYAINRAVRILPLYYTAIVLLLLLQEHGGTGTQWWRFLSFSENFSPVTYGKVDGSLWSLVVELHFYVLLPFLAAGLARAARSSRLAAGALLLAAGGLSIGLRYTVGNPSNTADLFNGSFPATFYFFVPGMLLALLRLEWQERPRRALAGPLGSSWLWLAGSAALWLAVFESYSLGPLAAPAAFLAIGACVLPLRDSRPRRAFDWPPLATIGVASYSVYVWHVPILNNLAAWHTFPRGTVAMFGIALPVCIAAGFASYKLIEEPWLRLRRRWSAASAPIEHAPRAEPAPIA